MDAEKMLTARLFAKQHKAFTVPDLAEALGVHKRTVYRWQKIGINDYVEGRDTLYRELAELLAANKAGEGLPRPKNAKVELKAATEKDFEKGLIEWEELPPEGLTCSFWPPRDMKGFLKARECARFVRAEAEWWQGSYASDPETWVRPGEEWMHERYRQITPRYETARFRAPMEIDDGN